MFTKYISEFFSSGSDDVCLLVLRSVSVYPVWELFCCCKLNYRTCVWEWHKVRSIIFSFLVVWFCFEIGEQDSRYDNKKKKTEKRCRKDSSFWVRSKGTSGKEIRNEYLYLSGQVVALLFTVAGGFHKYLRRQQTKKRSKTQEMCSQINPAVWRRN